MYFKIVAVSGSKSNHFPLLPSPPRLNSFANVISYASGCDPQIIYAHIWAKKLLVSLMSALAFSPWKFWAEEAICWQSGNWLTFSEAENVAEKKLCHVPAWCLTKSPKEYLLQRPSIIMSWVVSLPFSCLLWKPTVSGKSFWKSLTSCAFLSLSITPLPHPHPCSSPPSYYLTHWCGNTKWEIMKMQFLPIIMVLTV